MLGLFKFNQTIYWLRLKPNINYNSVKIKQIKSNRTTKGTDRISVPPQTSSILLQKKAFLALSFISASRLRWWWKIIPKLRSGELEVVE